MSAKKSFARSISFLTAFLCAALLTACGPSADTSEPQAAAQPQAQEASIEASARATELAKNSIIVDTHIDVPYRLDEEWANVSEATDGGDFDYPRAVAGGLNAPFMSIYTPAELQTEGGAKDLAEKLIDMVNEIAAQSPEKFAVAYSPLDIERQFNEGLISLPMGMENGAPLEDDIANVGHFYDRGIRYVTLAHSLSNLISDSSYDDNKQWGGLSEFGVDVVREMNRLGIISRKRLKQESESLCAELGFEHLDPNALVSEIPLAQRQLVEIAKALSHDPKLLILDEPTSALDIDSEYDLMLLLGRLKAQVLIVVISHRPSAIKLSDMIMLIERGGLAAAGTYEELKQSSDHFRDMMEKVFIEQ